MPGRFKVLVKLRAGSTVHRIVGTCSTSRRKRASLSRNDRSLSRKASSARRRAVMSVKVPIMLSTLPSGASSGAPEMTTLRRPPRRPTSSTS